jgi:pyruvate dehydrogenase E1 component
MPWCCESQSGQLLGEGINEAGALSSWIAAATSCSVHGLAMLPVCIDCSMFGFQRGGDLMQAAAALLATAHGSIYGVTRSCRAHPNEVLMRQPRKPGLARPRR